MAQTSPAVLGPVEPTVRPAAPRVEACIAAVMDRHPGASTRADARYYEAVHQELAPLARRLEAELTAERDRIGALLAAIREHWVKANGEDSLSVGALDVIAEVIADGSYVESGPNVRAERGA